MTLVGMGNRMSRGSGVAWVAITWGKASMVPAKGGQG